MRAHPLNIAISCPIGSWPGKNCWASLESITQTSGDAAVSDAAEPSTEDIA